MEVGNVIVYFAGMILTILLATFMRYCFNRDERHYYNTDEPAERLLPRVVYFLIILLSFIPILNVILACLAIIAVSVLSFDKDLIRDCKFTKWLFG